MRKKLQGGHWLTRRRMTNTHREGFSNILKHVKSGRNTYPYPGETEVFTEKPEAGKCYNYLKAERKAPVEGGKYKYFTSKEPMYTYAGKFLYKARWGNRNVRYAFSDKNGKDIEIKENHDEHLCFLETECEMLEKTATEENANEEVSSGDPWRNAYFREHQNQYGRY